MNIKIYLTGLIAAATITISSCGQKAVTDKNLKTTDVKETTFDATGYTAGTIVQSKTEGDCKWSIELKDGKYVEAIDMNKDFLVNGTTVWIKYTPQRRMQRCDKAAPVAINEMVKRE